MTMLRHLALCLLAAVAVSCGTTYAPRVDASFKPDQNTAVLYGRLDFTDTGNIANASATEHRMALQLVNEANGRELYVRFNQGEAVSCASVPPGHYKLTGFVATDARDRILGGKLFGPEDKINIRMTMMPHSAVYLGDFAGYVKLYKYGELTTIETGLTQVTNNFVETTKRFREAYPHLEALPARAAD